VQLDSFATVLGLHLSMTRWYDQYFTAVRHSTV